MPEMANQVDRDMMKILGTGKKNGYSLVEVLVTITLILTAYIAIAKGLIATMKLGQKTEQNAVHLLKAEEYFYTTSQTNESATSVLIEEKDETMEIHTLQFKDSKEYVISEYKAYRKNAQEKKDDKQ